jgi:hypothetical protein
MYYDKHMANNLPAERQIAIIGSICEGSSIHSIERMTGVQRDTIMRSSRQDRAWLHGVNRRNDARPIVPPLGDG